MIKNPIQDSDSSCNQTAMDHAKSDYALSNRYAEKTIMGFQPMVKEGVVGKVEIMNEDGSPHLALNSLGRAMDERQFHYQSGFGCAICPRQ